MPREAVLVRTLVEVADNLVDDFDVVDVLTLLSERCAEVLDVAAAGVMLAAPSSELQAVASSSGAMRLLELFELQADEGPCVDCYRTAQPVVNVELQAVNGLWPRFTPRALEAGFRSVHAIPMRLRGRTIGALNLFRTGTGALEESDVIAAQALADVATIAIVQHLVAVDNQMVNAQLAQALNSRIVIEQAKGRISEAVGVSVDEAFQILRRHARNNNLRLGALGAGIADGTIDPRGLDPLPPSR